MELVARQLRDRLGLYDDLFAASHRCITVRKVFRERTCCSYPLFTGSYVLARWQLIWMTLQHRSASQTPLDRLSFGVSARFFDVEGQLEQCLLASVESRFFV